jgi:hypothetical protein
MYSAGIIMHRASSEPSSTRPNKAGADSRATQSIANKGGVTTQIGHKDADSRRTEALHHTVNLVCRRPRFWLHWLCRLVYAPSTSTSKGSKHAQQGCRQSSVVWTRSLRSVM